MGPSCQASSRDACSTYQCLHGQRWPRVGQCRWCAQSEYPTCRERAMSFTFNCQNNRHDEFPWLDTYQGRIIFSCWSFQCPITQPLTIHCLLAAQSAGSGNRNRASYPGREWSLMPSLLQRMCRRLRQRASRMKPCCRFTAGTDSRRCRQVFREVTVRRCQSCASSTTKTLEN